MCDLDGCVECEQKWGVIYGAEIHLDVICKGTSPLSFAPSLSDPHTKTITKTKSSPKAAPLSHLHLLPLFVGPTEKKTHTKVNTKTKTKMNTNTKSFAKAPALFQISNESMFLRPKSFLGEKQILLSISVGLGSGEKALNKSLRKQKLRLIYTHQHFGINFITSSVLIQSLNISITPTSLFQGGAVGQFRWPT